MNTTYDALLRSSGLPRIEARLLMSHVSGLSHAALIAESEQQVPENQQQQFQQLVARQQAGEPIAYLLGQKEFYGRAFGVNDCVLIPRPETEHLIDTALSHCDRGQNLRVLDLGTGSGILAITLALDVPLWQVYASDVSAGALATAQQNAQTLGAGVEFYLGSWFQALPADQQPFDLIVSNPPYVAADDPHLKQGDLRFEPAGALTDYADGLVCYQEIIGQADKYLRSGGWLMLEHGFQQAEQIRQLMQLAAFREIETHHDLAGLERLTIGQWH